MIDDLIQYTLPLLGGLGGFGTGGLYVNVILTLWAVPLAIIFGVVLGLLRVSSIQPISMLATAFIEIAKATPLILGIFWLYYFLPKYFGYDVSLFVSGVIALVFSGASSIAEVTRAGWNTISKTQLQSGMLSGLTKTEVSIYIVIPQVLYVMVPAVLSVTVGIFKDTATVFVIGIVELTQSGMIIANANPDKLISIYIIIGLGYLIVCSTLSLIASYIQKITAKRLPTVHV